MAKLTLSIGSNLGDRDDFLRRARNLLGERLGPLVYESEIVETAAWGNTAQAAFLNQVVVVDLALHAGAGPIAGSKVREVLHAILDITQAIERELGRERKEHWGPRTVDVDLIFLDDISWEDERVSLPHPWWRERGFVVDLLP